MQFLGFSLVCSFNVLLCTFLGTGTGFQKITAASAIHFAFQKITAASAIHIASLQMRMLHFYCMLLLDLFQPYATHIFFISFSIAFHHQLLKNLEYFVTYACLSLDAHSVFCFLRNVDTVFS